MTKILSMVTLLVITVIFSACGKVPFEKQEVKSDSALVYVYIEFPSGINDADRNPPYEIGVNGTKLKGDIRYGDYKFYRLKPTNMTISAYRAGIEEQSIEMTLSAGKTYFLRIKSFSDDFAKFEITRVNSKVAYEALNETTLSGEYESTQAAISELIIEDKSEESAASTTTVIHSKSKTDEILSAAKLKEQGLLSDEEFNKLKSEILAR